jgi:hypothetical protein
MNRFFYIFVTLVVTSCCNWKEIQVPYDKELYLEKLHVHFYDHNTCEWSCLDMDEGIYCVDDTLNLRVKKNNLGEVKKVKILK